MDVAQPMAVRFLLREVGLRNAITWIARIAKVKWTVDGKGIVFRAGPGKPIVRVYDLREMYYRDTGWGPWDEEGMRIEKFISWSPFQFSDWEEHGLRWTFMYPLLIARGSPEIHARIRGRMRGFQSGREQTLFPHDRLTYAVHHKKVTLDLKGTKLTEVLAQLKKLTGLHYVPVLKKGEDPPVTLRVRDMKLVKALSWIAERSGTRWSIENNAVSFSDPELDEVVERFYPVGDLFTPWG